MEAQVTEFKANLKEVQGKCDEVTNESRARGACVAQLEESLAASEQRNQDRARKIEDLKKDLVKTRRRVAEAKDETVHVQESMELLRGQLTNMVKKAERRAKLAEGQKDFLENSLNAERKERILRRWQRQSLAGVSRKCVSCGLNGVAKHSRAVRRMIAL